MIPLKDLTPRRSVPLITYLLIAANVVVFFYQLSLGPHAGEQLVFEFGMVPARVGLALTSPKLSLGGALLPLLTSMFLHGGWLHILGNMWFLWIFGDNVEDRLGHFAYLGFYLVCGLAAGLTHIVFNWGSEVPSIGASGAISGVMGAYLVLFPRSRVLTLVPLLVIWFTVRLPAIIMIGYWFLIQFLSGLATLGARQAGGVAFWAHVGGFLAGVVLVAGIRRRSALAY
jgi:membrane associated rhomboid family serine protease